MPKGKGISWTDEEWSILAKAAWGVRAKHPEMTLVEIIKQVQEQLPADRKRPPSSLASYANIGRLLAGIARLDLELRTQAAKADELQHTLASWRQRPTREEVLNGLTDREVIERFAGRVLASLAGHFAAELVQRVNGADTGLAEIGRRPVLLPTPPTLPPPTLPPATVAAPAANGNGHKPHPKPATMSRPRRILFIGVIASHRFDVENAVGPQFACVFNDRHNAAVIPLCVDYVVIWNQHTDKDYRPLIKSKLPDVPIITHSGGFKSLLTKLRNIVCQPQPA